MNAVRSAEDNPFEPGFGSVPAVWAGRGDILPQHAVERRQRLLGRYTRGGVFVGPSGIGKSVLVNRFAKESAQRGDLVLPAIRVAKRSDPIAQLAKAAEQSRQGVAFGTLADSAERLLRRLKVVAVKGVQFAPNEANEANPHLVVRDSLIALGEALAHENASRPFNAQRVMLIRIDELQNADEAHRSQLLAILGDLLEEQVAVPIRDGAGTFAEVHLPVVVYLTGLPSLTNKRTDADTFRRRFNTKPLGMLADAEVVEALLNTPLPGGVRFTDDAAMRLAHLVAGDPYLLQLVGQQAWLMADDGDITVADVNKADDATYGDRLRSVEAALADIPESELDVLQALYAVVDKQLTASPDEVALQLGMKTTQIASAAGRLEGRAAITRRQGLWQVENRLLHRYLTTGAIH